MGSRHVFDSAVLKDAVGKTLIPEMEGGMTLFYGHEQTLSGCADLVAGSQAHQHLGPAFANLLDLRAYLQSDPVRRRPPELDGVRCGHGAGTVSYTHLTLPTKA